MDSGGLGLTVTAGHKVAVLELLRLAHCYWNTTDYIPALNPLGRAQDLGHLFLNTI